LSTKKKLISFWAISIVVIVITLVILQRLLVPKYMSDVVEGALISEYYNDPKNHDVIFVGDCELYENIDPATLWEEYGINSYIRGSAQQLIWQSYYLMEDTLKYEKPDVIVFNVLSMKYNEPQNEAYNRMNIDGMKWSKSKIDCINASMTEDEHFIEYVFPILRFHSRYSELNSDDINYLFDKKKVSYNGYYMRTDVRGAENVPEGRPLDDYNFGDNAYSYLDKMVELCDANDVELVLVKAPSLYPYWYDQWDKQIEDYANSHNLKYYNFLENTDEIGLDFSQDTYDGGLHLNYWGATKLSKYFGNILANDCGLESRRGEEPLETQWAEKIRIQQEDIKNGVQD